MVYDLIIIGGGPAGISAGIYAGRARLKTLIIEKENVGGQIRTTHEMVNYPGILQTTGSQYMETLRKQALDFNVKFKEDEVVDLNLDNDIKIIKTNKEEIQARSVILQQVHHQENSDLRVKKNLQEEELLIVQLVMVNFLKD